MTENASIFRFKLPIRGYGFCKVIPVITTDNDFMHLVHVYDYYGRFELNKDTFDRVLAKDYLINPLPMKSLPLNRGYGAWRLLGKVPLEKDLQIPDFKFTKEPLTACEQAIKRWHALHDLTNKSKKAFSYNAVKHLEHFHLYTPQEIEVRTSMEILKKENTKIKLFFDLSHPIVLDNYHRTINMPVYADIPDDIKGKVQM